MISDLEIGQFHAFGFVVLRGCLEASEMEELNAAFERWISQAPRYLYFNKDSQSRMINHVEDQDRIIAALIVHPRIIDTMRDIWGTTCLFIGSNIWSNLDETPWHTDNVVGRYTPTIKVTYYLDVQTTDQGSFNVIPSTHHPQWSQALFKNCGYWDRDRPRLRLDPMSIPGAVSIATRPGDVVLWDNRLWHSALKRKDGRPRRGVFFQYLPDPQNDLVAMDEAGQQIAHALSEDHPSLYSEQLLAHNLPELNHMADRLASLGHDQGTRHRLVAATNRGTS